MHGEPYDNKGKSVMHVFEKTKHWHRINNMKIMTKISNIEVKSTAIKTMQVGGIDYICITDIAKQKNPVEPKDVVKNWLRSKNTLEYLGLWECLNNPNFKGVEFDPLLKEAGSNAFTMSPTRWIETTNAIGLITKKRGEWGYICTERHCIQICQLGFSRI
jgi:hypothetical protein